jgi:hypothetical protein
MLRASCRSVYKTNHLLYFVFSVCFETDLFVSVVSILIRNTETNRKNNLLVSRNQPKNNRNRLSFGLFRLEPKIYFVCFEDTLVGSFTFKISFSCRIFRFSRLGVVSLLCARSWGDIFRVQRRRVPLTIVFRNREIGGRLCTKWWKKVLFLLKYSLDRNHTIFYDVSYTIYPLFLCSGTLWFAKNDVFVL